MAGRKREHLEESIRQKLGTILYEAAKDPRFAAVTISREDLSKDKSVARVYYATYREDVDIDDLTASLNHAAGFFGATLGRTLSVRHTPKLRFYYDRGFDYADRIERLLSELHHSGE